MRTEQLIIKNLLNNNVYSQKVLPYLKDEYFKDSDLIAFRLIREYVIKYGKQPSKDELLVSIPQVRGYTDAIIGTTLKEVEDFDLTEITTNVDWLVDKTEQFCSDRAIENAIRESISILNSDGKKSKDVIPDLLSEALGITFDPSVGHDYLEDYEERYDLLHNPIRRIPFDLDMFNRITKNGLPPKTLNIIIGGINVGKTLTMSHMAAANLAAGKNVLYITLEMAEEEIASRIDANLLDIALDDLSVIDRHIFTSKIKDLKTKALGKLVIKEYPTSGANVIHFKSLLNELMIKKNFRPDIIYIDYINICGCASMKFNGDTYNYVKMIAQELRGWAVEECLPIVSGTQLTRKGFGSSQPGMDDTSESFALPATVDFMIAIVTSPELDQLGQYMVFQLKNRYGNKKKNAAFVIGVDMDKQRLYNVTQPGGQQPPIPPPIIVQQPGGLANKFQGIKI
jgi:replicative DNA helicase